ncbi:MAG: NTP transferase domain-containing protein [Anaerolineales bacterium]|jgi:molybdenum cofactor cytidylyltransferase
MIGAVVLAAGLSRRMGRPKMTLPWQDTTVIGRVVSVLLDACIEDVLVVTGGARRDVENVLVGLPVSTIFNPDYRNGEMMQSLRVGLNALHNEINAAMVVLGDQPQIELDVVKSILSAYKRGHHIIVVPSFQYRRGHPWLVDRALWDVLLNENAISTMRQFLNQFGKQIHYVDVSTASIFQDLDTPEDYLKFQNRENR